MLKCRSIKPNSTDLSDLSGFSVIFNTESLYFYFRNAAYRDYVSNCENIFIDGAVLSLIAKLFLLDIKRYHGPDVLADLEHSGLLGNAILIGGSEQNKILVENNILKSWVELPYSHSPEVLAEAALAKLRHQTDARIVLISLGLPKQELVAHVIGKKLGRSDLFFLPLGAAIDFRTGVAKRSSQVWTKFGFEWLPRLIREPRMLKRNVKSLIGAVYFLFHLLFNG